MFLRTKLNYSKNDRNNWHVFTYRNQIICNTAVIINIGLASYQAHTPGISIYSKQPPICFLPSVSTTQFLKESINKMCIEKRVSIEWFIEIRGLKLVLTNMIKYCIVVLHGWYNNTKKPAIQ